MEAAIITTFRCIQKCAMCGIWKNPSRPEEEFEPALLRRLPQLEFANITGGEPFLRDDLAEIADILRSKARRVVISTNGLLTDRITDLARSRRDLGFRISLEGLPEVNDRLRGVAGSFDRGLRTVLALRRLDIRDVGFGITLSDANTGDLLPLYDLAKGLKAEFATAAVHNSWYFHTGENRFARPGEAVRALEELVEALLRSRRPKDWFRAYFTHGLAEYVRGSARQLPCGAGTDMFFLDPWGEIWPCNGAEPGRGPGRLGNLKERTFEEIWSSAEAVVARAAVRDCPKNCWMIGTAAPAMKADKLKPALWVLRRKLGRRRRPA
jgi:radical SAM protein with 4Fe4S-binding SPASM domain